MANRTQRSLLLSLVVLVGMPASARAQVVQDCEPNQFLDRTAPGADRDLAWDFSILDEPERCMQVQAGQTVYWDGDFGPHPLAGQGGDTPNPINSHENGFVTFSTPGTFGFACLEHSAMKGAIKVVAAPPAPTTKVPALSSWLLATAAALLLAGGFVLLRGRSPQPVATTNTRR